MNTRFARILAGIAFVSWAVVPLHGQTPPTQRLSFEAATIKENTSVQNGIGNRFGPALYSWTNVPLRILILQIYRLKDYQLVEATNWVNTVKWDISARASEAATSEDKNEMAKALLGDRFQLKFHWEKRQLPMYSLVAMKDGPKFQQPKSDDRPSLRLSSGLIAGNNWNVAGFANILSTQLNIPVIDKVGLKGSYNFEVKWTPMPNEANFATRNGTGVAQPNDPSGPTIFTALQEQLGLKLEAGKGEVEVFVIDSVAKPSEN